MEIFRYTIRWTWAGNEGIRVVYATDEEFAVTKLWSIIELDFKPHPKSNNKTFDYKILKTEKYTTI